MFIRRTIVQRRVHRRSLCRGASKYAATVKQSRPPLVILPPSNSRPSNNKVYVQAKKRKRRQSCRRRDRRIRQSTPRSRNTPEEI